MLLTRIRRPIENFKASAVSLALYVSIRAINSFSVFIMPFSIAVLEFDSLITSWSSLLPSCPVGGLLRQFLRGKCLRKNIADPISPTAVMFDDLISNVRHIRLSFFEAFRSAAFLSIASFRGKFSAGMSSQPVPCRSIKRPGERRAD
jgi:hypothetical protein